MFSEEVIEFAWIRANGRCECTLSSHNHFAIRCNNKVVLEKRNHWVTGGWVANIKIQNAGNTSSNCEILCFECYELVRQKRLIII